MECEFCKKEFDWKTEGYIDLSITGPRKACEHCNHEESKSDDSTYCSLECLKKAVRLMK
jgi:hypothetical protein